MVVNAPGRNFHGNQIAWSYRACAGHAFFLFRGGHERQAMECGYLITLCLKNRALVPSRAEIWPQTHVAKRINKMTRRNGKHPEEDLTKEVARSNGLSVAAYIRMAILQRVRRDRAEAEGGGK